METTININDYLSEERKIKIAENVFADRIANELFKTSPGSVQSDSEIQRIIGNISHKFISAEISRYMPDYESRLREQVVKLIEERSFSHATFHRKDAWGGGDSEAIKIIDATIRDLSGAIKDKITEAVNTHDYSAEVSNEIASEFEDMASTLYKLAELFQK
jgi:hypothetical protein